MTKKKTLLRVEYMDERGIWRPKLGSVPVPSDNAGLLLAPFDPAPSTLKEGQASYATHNGEKLRVVCVGFTDTEES